jgi:hypothetical protein
MKSNRKERKDLAKDRKEDLRGLALGLHGCSRKQKRLS